MQLNGKHNFVAVFQKKWKVMESKKNGDDKNGKENNV